MSKRQLVVLWVTISCSVLAGCQGTVHVTSDPPGALAYQSSGTGPFADKWDPGEAQAAGIRLQPPLFVGWMDTNLQSLFSGMVGARGRTPTTYSRQFEIEACKVVWPDGTESDVKLSEKDTSGTLPVRFHFVKATDSGASSGPRDGLSNVSCDLRIARVVDGSSIANGSGQGTADKLERLAKALAGQLREGILVKGESIAVVSLRNRSGTRQGRVIADELADKVTGALIDTGWFDVKERIDLRAVLGEKDLESAGIVKQAKVKDRLAGIKYIVIGGVTVTERSKGQ